MEVYLSMPFTMCSARVSRDLINGNIKDMTAYKYNRPHGSHGGDFLKELLADMSNATLPGNLYQLSVDEIQIGEMYQHIQP